MWSLNRDAACVLAFPVYRPLIFSVAESVSALFFAD